MNVFVRSGLGLARRLPRGGFPLVRRLARQNTELQRLPVRLTSVPGATLEVDLRETVFFPLWKFGYYPHQLAEDDLALSFLRTGDCVWDVGANIGYTALLYRHAVGESGAVVAFEPGPRIFPYLARAVRPWTNIVPMQFAISDAEGSVFFEEKSHLDMSAVVAGRAALREAVEVRTVTLDGILPGLRVPDFLKIDVEGHEVPVLRGGTSLIRTHSPLIQFEALDPETLRAVLNVLEEAAPQTYTIYQINHDKVLTRSLDASRPGSTHNFLAVAERHRQRFGDRLPDRR